MASNFREKKAPSGQTAVHKRRHFIKFEKKLMMPPCRALCIGTIVGTYQSDQVTMVNFINGHQPCNITFRRFSFLPNFLAHLLFKSVSVDSTPYLLIAAMSNRAFQNFVVPWKIHISQKLISTRCIEWCKGCLCKFLQHVGLTTWFKIMLKLQKISKYEKIDETPVNHPSDWAQNTS